MAGKPSKGRARWLTREVAEAGGAPGQPPCAPMVEKRQPSNGFVALCPVGMRRAA